MMTQGSNKAIFLDRDGVLNVDLGYTYKPKDLRLVSGAIEGLRELRTLGYKLVVVTNQSGVARGFFSLADVEDFHQELLLQIRHELPGFSFDATMICPHKDSDIECAINAGMKGIQVTKGGKQYPKSKKAFAMTETLREAAKLIKSNSF